MQAPAPDNSLTPAAQPTPDLAPQEPLPLPPPANPLLARYRGHRTRTWGEAEALKALAMVAHGAPKSRALRESGIPEDAAYYHPQMAAAISELYTHEGVEALEERLEEVEDGTRDHRTVPAIIARLRLRGRLLGAGPAAPVAAPAIALQIVVIQPPTDGART